GGTLGGSGTLTVTGTFTWTGGLMADAGMTAITATGMLNISGDSVKFLSQRLLTNAGLATWTGAGTIGMGNEARLVNETGATFNAQRDAGLPPYLAGDSTFVNAGTFKKSASAGTTALNVTFDNAGSVDIRSGTLSLGGGGMDSGSFTVAGGATLNFTGG